MARRVRIKALFVAAVSVLAVVPVVATTAGALPARQPTRSGDDLRTAWYDDQPGLDPAIVAGGQFGQLAAAPVTGQIYAQPIVSGSTVVVVTEANWLYGFDRSTLAKQWERQLSAVPFNPAELPCSDITPTVGITGTPVVDPATNTAYFVAKGYQSGASGAVSFEMHGVDVATGIDRPGFPVVIDGHADNARTVTFDARYQNQRPGLLLMNGVVYAGFGSSCDLGNFYGWVVGVSTAGQIRARWSASTALAPNNGAGIWMSGGGLVSDRPGSILLTTGNGGEAGAAPIAGTNPPGRLGESLVRLDVQGNGSLAATDFFSPYNAVHLDEGDLDFGSGAPVGLPDTNFGTASIPHLAITAGKEGYVYLVNRDDLGGLGTGTAGADRVLSRIGPFGGFWSSPAVWGGDGGYVYLVSGTGGTASGTSSGRLHAFRYGLDAGGQPSLAWAGASSDGFSLTSGTPAVTSSGTTPGSALVWVVWSPNGSRVGAQLRAYRPVPTSGSLDLVYSSPIGTASKFATVGVFENRLYVPTASGQLLMYGAPVNAALAVPATSFGTVVISASASATVTITATAATSITALASSSSTFSLGAPSRSLPAAMTPGDVLTVPVTFAPTIAGPAAASVVVTTPTGLINGALSGTGLTNGPNLVLSSRSMSFGGTVPGSTITNSVELANLGSTILTLSNIGRPAAPFAVGNGPNAGATLPPNGRITVSFTFSPTAQGSFTGTYQIGSDGGTATVYLFGTAAPAGLLTLSPSTIDFGHVPVGRIAAKTLTATNTGQTAIQLVRSKLATAGTVTSASGLEEGVTLQPGESKSVVMSYAPTAIGVLAESWEFNVGNGVQTVAMVGSGTFATLGRDLLGRATTVPNNNTQVPVTVANVDVVAGDLIVVAVAATNTDAATVASTLQSGTPTTLSSVIPSTTLTSTGLGGLSWTKTSRSFDGGWYGHETAIFTATAPFTAVGGTISATVSGTMRNLTIEANRYSGQAGLGPSATGDAVPGAAANGGLSAPRAGDVVFATIASSEYGVLTTHAGIPDNRSTMIGEQSVNWWGLQLYSETQDGPTASWSSTGGVGPVYAAIVITVGDGSLLAPPPPAPTPTIATTASVLDLGVTGGRLVDTRIGHGGTRLESDGVISVDIAKGASAAVLQLTAVGAAAAGFLTAWPCDQGRPLASQVNFVVGDPASSSATVALDGRGRVCVYSPQAVDVVVDLVAAYRSVAGAAAAGRFVATRPTRLFDTRDGAGLFGIGETRTYVAGVPAGAAAVVVNLTATNSAGGYLAAYAAGISWPGSSNLNVGRGETRANAVVVPLSPNGAFTVLSQLPADVIVDVLGYYTGADAAAATSGEFIARTPFRALDTRTDGETLGIGGGLDASLSASGMSSSSIGTVLTVTDIAHGTGFVTVWPGRQAQPGTSTINANAGTIVANMAEIGVGAASVSVYSQVGSDVVIDVAGWFIA